MATSIHPSVKWADRDDIVLLSLELADATVKTCDVVDGHFVFDATSGDKHYALKVETFGDLSGLESAQTSRRINVTLKKAEEGRWPRLMKAKGKVPWLKVDWAKWKDEDESSEDAPDPMAGMGGMGGMPGMGGMGGMGGDFDFAKMMAQMGGAGAPGEGGDFDDDVDFDVDDAEGEEADDAE